MKIFFSWDFCCDLQNFSTQIIHKQIYGENNIYLQVVDADYRTARNMADAFFSQKRERVTDTTVRYTLL